MIDSVEVVQDDYEGADGRRIPQESRDCFEQVEAPGIGLDQGDPIRGLAQASGEIGHQQCDLA